MSDQEILLQFLPANVWAEIGNKVVQRRNGQFNIENFQNMSNASPYFRDILLPKRALALVEPTFQVAVPWLQEFEEKKITAKSSKSKEELENELQTKGKEIVSSIILNSRGVCKTWSLAMDKIIYDLTNYQVMGEGWNERFRGLEKGGLYFVVEICNVRKFVRQFEATHNSQALVDRSPFIGRRAFVVLCRFGTLDHHRDPRYPGEVVRVFKMFGRHLRSLRLHVVDNFLSAVECYCYMRQMLTHLPNLTELDIKYDSMPARSMEEWDALEVDNEENQLPHFPDLVQLVVKLPRPILNQLVGQNSHATRITVTEM